MKLTQADYRKNLVRKGKPAGINWETKPAYKIGSRRMVYVFESRFHAMSFLACHKLEEKRRNLITGIHHETTHGKVYSKDKIIGYYKKNGKSIKVTPLISAPNTIVWVYA